MREIYLIDVKYAQWEQRTSDAFASMGRTLAISTNPAQKCVALWEVFETAEGRWRLSNGLWSLAALGRGLKSFSRGTSQSEEKMSLALRSVMRRRQMHFTPRSGPQGGCVWKGSSWGPKRGRECSLGRGTGCLVNFPGPRALPLVDRV